MVLLKDIGVAREPLVFLFAILVQRKCKCVVSSVLNLILSSKSAFESAARA